MHNAQCCWSSLFALSLSMWMPVCSWTAGHAKNDLQADLYLKWPFLSQHELFKIIVWVKLKTYTTQPTHIVLFSASADFKTSRSYFTCFTPPHHGTLDHFLLLSSNYTLCTGLRCCSILTKFSSTRQMLSWKMLQSRDVAWIPVKCVTHSSLSPNL